MFKLVFCTLATLLLLSEPVHAYIGPGTGIGTIAVVFGILASVFITFIAIIWYPLKRLFRKRLFRKRRAPDDRRP